jgi:small GTP-binding protein
MSMNDLKVVAVGDGNVGKTSLLVVLNGEPFPRPYPLFIVEDLIKNLNFHGVSYKLRLWERAEDEFGNAHPLSYKDANVILLCFALDSKQSFINLTLNWINEAEHSCPKAKTILLGTKSDARKPDNVNHVTDIEAMTFKAEQQCWAFITCSSKSGHGIDKILRAVVKACSMEKNTGCSVL